MSELPEGWAPASITDIASIHDNLRIPLNGRQRAEMPGEHPYYGANGLVDHVGDFIFEGDYVLLAEDGGHFDDPKRRVAYTVSGQFWVNNHAHVLKAEDGIEPDFVKHWLNAKDWMPHVGGSTRLKLTQAGLRAAELPIPPLPEQRRIVAKLDRLSARSAAARDHLARTTKLATRAKQAILKVAVFGELTQGWRETRCDLSDWKECTLGEVAAGFNYGSAAKSAKEGDVPVLRMGNIQEGKLNWEDLVFTSVADEISKYDLRSGDLLFNRTNSPALVGKTAVYRGERPAIFAGYLIRVKCGPEVLPDFVSACLNSEMGRDYCWRVKTDGVSQSNINANKLKAFPMRLPPLNEQAEIVRRIEAAFARIDRLTEEATRAVHLLDRLDERLLAKAFRGELVQQNPEDEPAEALLARIREARATAAKPNRRPTRRARG